MKTIINEIAKLKAHIDMLEDLVKLKRDELHTAMKTARVSYEASGDWYADVRKSKKVKVTDWDAVYAYVARTPEAYYLFAKQLVASAIEARGGIDGAEVVEEDVLYVAKKKAGKP